MEYSDKVTFILTKEKPQQVVENMKSPEINSLVVNIMREKFSKAYSKNLSKAQISIVNEWVLNGHSEALLSEMKATKLLCLDVLSDYKNKCSNEFISNNLKHVHENVLGAIFEGQINESHIIKAMTMQDIIRELSGSNENE